VIGVKKQNVIEGQRLTYPGVLPELAMFIILIFGLMEDVQGDFWCEGCHLSFHRRLVFMDQHQINIRRAPQQGAIAQQGTGEIHSMKVWLGSYALINRFLGKFM
jgi:hypothetical protein